MRRTRSLVAFGTLFVGLLATAHQPVRAQQQAFGGLTEPATITRDVHGVAHISASSLHDALYLNGWVHAQDRLFQMDVTRRQASGTLAELLGRAALPSDVQARTIGLRRAAERTWAAASADLKGDLEAYADGVNAYVTDHPLPPEYAALGLDAVAPWTPVDSLAVGKAISFGLSFDSDVGNTVLLQAYVAAFGPTHGYDLFSQDLMRSQPFSDAATVPDATGTSAPGRHGTRRAGPAGAALTEAARPRRGAPRMVSSTDSCARATSRRSRVVTSRVPRAPTSGRSPAGTRATDEPIVANDPHLGLDEPSTFYPIGLAAPGLDVVGEGFAGAPGVIVGHNRDIAWGATVNPMDVTDTYLEKVVPDATSPSGLSTIYQGSPEHVVPVPQTFRYNSGGTLVTATAADHVPPVTLIVPRRNQGPIVQLDLAHQSALSIQYTGFSATFELETFLRWDRARNLEDFRQGLQTFDVGSQNWAYADRAGNIAYFTSAEMPVREDLQAGTVTGMPPWFVRNGQGGNEWLPVQHPQPGQAIPYEIYPAAEMPPVVNPCAGWFVNANNDPAGTALDNDPLNQLRPGGGIYYLNPGYDGFRAGRITEMLRARLDRGRRVSTADIEALQADTTMIDAEYFVPWIVRAYDAARASAVPQLAALAQDPQVNEAVGRLAHWDFTTPTGIPQGYDASDPNGHLLTPSRSETADSVAATIYAAWRSRAITGIVDAPLGGLPKPDGAESVTALRHLLDTWGSAHGVGASGIDFFAVPGIPDPAAARDYRLLDALASGLAMLAGPAFDAAFHGSTDQADYRWGLLHRLTLAHPLGGPYSVPTGFGAFPAPLQGLDGIPVDGGFGTVDAASHDVRGASADGFRFDSGPARRFVATPRGSAMWAESALPGGTSAVPGSPFYLNLLRPYLTDDYYSTALSRP